MDPGQAGQSFRPDLDPNCLTLMVFLIIFLLKKWILKIGSAEDEKACNITEDTKCSLMILSGSCIFSDGI